MDTQEAGQKAFEFTSESQQTKEIYSDVVADAIRRNATTEKRGRGRPRKTFTMDNQPTFEKPQQTKQNNKVVELTPQDEQMIVGLSDMIMTSIDSLICTKIESIAVKISDEKTAKKLSHETRLTTDEKNNIGQYTLAIAKKYGISAKWCPEVGLAIVLGGYGLRVTSTLKELKSIASEFKNATQPKID